MPRLLLVSVLLFVLGPAVHAAKIKVWHQHTPADYDGAQLKQVVVSSEGALRLSRQLKPLADLNATHIWDVIEERDGKLLAATDDGKIYRVTPDGTVSVAFDSQESQILCLVQAPDGTVYAGTGPSGLIVRLSPGGKAKVLYHSPENYVWALALDPKGHTIYAATGPKGRIYQITRDGKASIFYTTKQDHVLCLATGDDGTVYAGTDKNGLVYKIDPKGKGFVLFQAPQAEIRCLRVTPDHVYAGTSAPTKRKPGASSSADRVSVSSVPATLASATRMAKTAVADKEDRGGKDTASSAHDKEEKGCPASAEPAPRGGENSLYRISRDGTVREVFREKAMFLSLLREDGKVFVGTGMDGQLFEVNETSKERSEIARLDHGQIHCLCKRKDGSIVLGTGDPGKLYVLQDSYCWKGTVVSEVLDAKIVSKWGSLRWKAAQAVTPFNSVAFVTSVTVATRSGNVAEPDETWSDWSAEQDDPDQAKVTAPPARFLQYRLTLHSARTEETPTVHGITIRYATTNQAPEITRIDVPDLDAINLDNPKKLKFKWHATDANEDDLTYDLYVRKDGWDSWVLLEEDWAKSDYDWDATTTPAGMYQLRVIARDRKDNPPGDALTGERISAAFAVAHEAPKVTVKVTAIGDGRAEVQAVAVDPLVRLTSASFAVNGKKWNSVFPEDGLFDSKRETFKFQTETLKPGTYVLVLRVRDAAGNVGSGDVVFTVPATQPK